jgi:RNA polymerase sigma-70 factor (ECF subfamily)
LPFAPWRYRSATNLLSPSKKGDDRAWATFYDSLAGEIRSYVVRIGAASADDVLGETMLQVVRDIGKFRGSTADLRPWTFRIARNRVIDAGRRRSRRPVETRLTSEADTETEGTDATIDGDLPTMLDHLTPDQRDAVWLRHVVGLSVDETARVMDKAPDAVAALCHRALRRLRAALGQP